MYIICWLSWEWWNVLRNRLDTWTTGWFLWLVIVTSIHMMVGLLYTLVLWRVVAKSVLSFGFNFPWKLRPQPSYGFVPAKRATGPGPPLAIGPHSEPRKLNFCSWRNETWAQYSGGPNNKQCQAPLVARCSSRRNIIDWSSYSILALIYFMNVWILSS